jgi:threonine/homoserine/homoserine lactone efflux protein
MLREEKIVRRSALLSFRFLFTAAFGSVLMGLVAAFGALPAQLAMLGCFVSIVGGLFLAYLGQEDERDRQRNAAIESLSVPVP